MAIFAALAPLLGEIDICGHCLFCMKFNTQQPLFEAFLDDGMGFFEKKNLKTVFGTPFTKKKVIFIFVVRPPFPQKW